MFCCYIRYCCDGESCCSSAPETRRHKEEAQCLSECECLVREKGGGGDDIPVAKYTGKQHFG